MTTVTTSLAAPQETARERRYRRQDSAVKLLPGQSVCICGRRLVPTVKDVSGEQVTPETVRVVVSEGRAHYRNLIQCKSVWTCPVCGGRISELRRIELTQAAAIAQERGYFGILITYTFQHNNGDNLEDLLSVLKGATSSFKSGRKFQALKRQYKWLGGFGSLEVTHGDNGFHPHEHEAAYLESSITEEQRIELEASMKKSWIKELGKQRQLRVVHKESNSLVGFEGLFAKWRHDETKTREFLDMLTAQRGILVSRRKKKALRVYLRDISESDLQALLAAIEARFDVVLRVVGYTASWEPSLHVDTVYSALAHYVTKWGHEPESPNWSPEHEVAKAVLKVGRKKNRTPFQLLDDYEQGDKRAGRLFQEYAHAIKGYRQLRWSPGFRQLLGLGAEVSDSDLIDQAEADEREALELYVDEWKKVLRQNLRLQVLVAVETYTEGDSLQKWLIEKGIRKPQPDEHRDDVRHSSDRRRSKHHGSESPDLVARDWMLRHDLDNWSRLEWIDRDTGEIVQRE